MASSTYVINHWKLTVHTCNSIDRYYLCHQTVKFNKCTTKSLICLAIPLHSPSYPPSLVRFVASPSNSLSGAGRGEIFQSVRKNESNEQHRFASHYESMLQWHLQRNNNDRIKHHKWLHILFNEVRWLHNFECQQLLDASFEQFLAEYSIKVQNHPVKRASQRDDLVSRLHQVS